MFDYFNIYGQLKFELSLKKKFYNLEAWSADSGQTVCQFCLVAQHQYNFSLLFGTWDRASISWIFTSTMENNLSCSRTQPGTSRV